MPSSTSSLVNKQAPNSTIGFLHHAPDGTLPSTSHKHPTRHSTSSSPLSIALPSSIRNNGSSSIINGKPSANGHGGLLYGYLHQNGHGHGTSMSHPPPSNSLPSLSHVHSSVAHNNPLSWQINSNSEDHNILSRPNGVSYSQQHYNGYQQHIQQHQPQQQQQQLQHQHPLSSTPSPSHIDTTLRRRRLSSVSASSKHARASHDTARPSSNKTSNITPHHTRRFTTLISDQEPDTTYLWGYLLFFATMLGFTISMYALVASNYMPMTGNKTLDWIKQDSHYCMLVPVTIPVTVLAVGFNWLGMKLFRHN